MKSRDRCVLMIVVALVALAGVYTMWVKPERKQAGTLGGQVATASQTLQAAQTALVDARQAQAGYPSAYRGLVSLDEAVPPTNDVPALLYEIQAAAADKQVQFNSVTLTGAAASAATPTPAGQTAAAAGIEQLPFTLQFSGNFFSLYHLLETLNDFTTQNANGNLTVGGRLLTIDGATIAPGNSSGAELQGTITATAYVLPAATAPAAPAAPTTATPTSGAPSTITPTGSSPSVPVTPAVAQSTP